MKSSCQLNRIFVFLFFVAFIVDVSGYNVMTEMVMMRDSVRLDTDIYLPVTSKPPWPVILMRTPYRKSSAMDPAIALLVCNFLHYAMVVQNTRGRYNSEGVDSLYFSDGWGTVRDGYDTVQWIESQSWCDGNIGTWGASALGITQYLLAGAAPPALKCCLVMVAASNMYEDALFYDGVYREAMVDGWLGGNQASHLIDFFSEHPLYEPMYDRLNLLTRLDSVTVPVLHVGGWHDIFVQGQINAFQGLQEYGGSGARGQQKLVIGPWIHNIAESKTGDLKFPDSNSLEWLGIMLEWFDYYLKDEQENSIADMPAVQYYLMGDADRPEGPGNRWIQSEIWPPEFQMVPLYFHEDSLLSLMLPSTDELPDQYMFDPDFPVPTRGGRNLNLQAGSLDQREVENREDVLVYTTAPIQDSIVIAGPVSVTLYASSDAVDTDFSAKLCDVYPDGRSMLVADGIVRARNRFSLWEETFLTPGEVSMFTIDLWSTAIAFASGHRIRVSISSSNSPRFAVNPNTGEPFRKETYQVIANQTVFHDTQYPSSLNLPVIAGIETQVPKIGSTAPRGIFLAQNYPNPFNMETVIPVHLPEPSGHYTLRVVDVLGRSIRQWELNNRSGDVLIAWHGENQDHEMVPSGMYMIYLTGEGVHLTRKLLLMK